MDKNSKIGVIQNAIRMAADLVVIAGIALGIFQLYQAKLTEKRQNTINAVIQTRSIDFLKAYGRLKAVQKSGQVKDVGSTSVVNDLNYVMNTYDHIALLYMNDLVDRCIVKNTIYSAIEEIMPIWETMKYPKEYRKNIETFKDMMSKEGCG